MQSPDIVPADATKPSEAAQISQFSSSTASPLLQRTIDTTWRRFFRDIWDYRGVFYFLVWRDFVVRYKQTQAGIWWAILHPLLGLAVYWWAFGIVARLPSDGTPYPLFIFAGLIPFTFVAEFISRVVDSLTGNSHLIQKIYFPRIFLPLSMLMIGLADFLIMLIIMLIMMVGYGVKIGTGLFMLIPLLSLATCLALGLGLLLAALNDRYRDVSRATGLFTRLLLFASPVFYSNSQVPTRHLWIYDLNPLSGIIQGFRASLLSSGTLQPHAFLSATIASVLAFLVGLAYFRKVDLTVADNL